MELNGNLSTCAENQSLLQNLQTVALLTSVNFAFNGQKMELNENLSTCAENQSLLQSLQTAALLAICKFCFQWTKSGIQRKSMNDKNHETCAKNHGDRRKWS